MKNLMKAPMMITIESWPSKRPCVNERLSKDRNELALWILEFAQTRQLGQGAHDETAFTGTSVVDMLWTCQILLKATAHFS